MTYILLRRDGPSVFMAVERKEFNRRTRVASDVIKVRDFGKLGALALAGQPNVVEDYCEEVLDGIKRDSAVPLVDRVWDAVSKLPQPNEITTLAVVSFAPTGEPQAHVIDCCPPALNAMARDVWTNVPAAGYALLTLEKGIEGFQKALEVTTAALLAQGTVPLTFEGVPLEAPSVDVYGTVYDIRHLSSAAGAPTIQSCVYDAANRMLTCQ